MGAAESPETAMEGSRSLLRPLLVAHLLNWLLLGVLSVQVYIYHISFPKDTKKTKTLVYFIYLVEFVQNAFIGETAIHLFADHFGDLHELNQIGSIWITATLMSALPAFISQAFYAYRVRVLSHSKTLPLVILLLSVTQGAAGLAVTVLGFNAKIISDLFTKEIVLITTIANASSALCDIIIAATLTYYLSGSRSGFRRTGSLLTKIIALIIGTGALTAMVTIINLVFLLLASEMQFFYFVLTGGTLGKLYANSILVVLNNRPSSEISSEDSTDIVISARSLHFSIPISGQSELDSRATRRYSAPGQ
ncbi:hypothetical protein BDN70DRAFT_993341 [Pholiota conissans]|uniref:DUF6534 domain-containing protein n=1 Tax=Pholiota conissans TaxID=109636 RepID=A0A9P5Z1U2_9AGAR|nr:hypothetical protein BDN70DRAFT_993341 [Pholiota conissans]